MMIVAGYKVQLYCDCQECVIKGEGSAYFAEYTGETWSECVKKARLDGWFIKAQRTLCIAPEHIVPRK